MRVQAAALPLLLLAGCGGGGLSEKELVAEGDKICSRINKQIAKEPDPKSAADLQRLAERTVELSDPAIEDMEALEPPDELEKDFAAFVKSLKQQRDLTKEIGEAAGAGDNEKIEKVGTEAQKAQLKYQKLSAKLGFKQCGGGN